MQLWNAARFMVETQTVSGIGIKESTDKFYALVKRAYDKGEKMKLDSARFQQIMLIEDPNIRELQLNEFAIENKLGITAAQMIAIAKMVCAVGCEVICPIINSL